MTKLKEGLKYHVAEAIREFLVGTAVNYTSGKSAFPQKQTSDSTESKLVKKQELLRAYIDSTPTERKVVQRSLRTFVPKGVSRKRYEDFLAACLNDLRKQGRNDMEIEETFVWLSKVKGRELDVLIILCTEIDDSGETYFIKGMGSQMEELKKKRT